MLLRKGMPVSGNFRNGGTYYPGVISAANADGTFDVNYNDGDKEKGVPMARLRVRGLKQQLPTAAGRQAANLMVTFMTASIARNKKRHMAATSNPQIRVANAHDLSQLCDILALDADEKKLLVGVGLDLETWRRLPRSQIEQVC